MAGARSRSAQLGLAAAAAACLAVALAQPQCRDRWQQPFSSDSVWNTPLGAQAAYTPAQIYTGFNASWGCALRVSAPSRRVACKTAPSNSSEAACVAAGCCYAGDGHMACFVPAGGPPDHGFHADQDLLVRGTPADPLTPFMDTAWNNPLCGPRGVQRGEIPFPVDWLSPGCALNNNAAALLLGDNVTLLQFQPLYRGEAGGPIMAQWPPSSPYPFIAGWNQSILGNGSWGAHGGSFLSSIGGTVRAGELAPGGKIPHALKLEFYGHDFYHAGWSGPPCFAWPALACDGYAHTPGSYGYNGSVPAVRPGALLAIPPQLAANVSAQLRTAPAQILLEALVSYGGRLVDDTAGDSSAICMEPAAIDDMLTHYNISVNITNAAFPNSDGPTGEFFWDTVTLFRALHAVTNDGPGAPGGPGPRVAPIAPPICGAD